jgi:hypothetical protein
VPEVRAADDQLDDLGVCRGVMTVAEHKPVEWVTVEYVRADVHRGAVEALRAASTYLERGSRISEDAAVRAQVDAALAAANGGQ